MTPARTSPDSRSTVLITGASSGIGAACARAFARAGFNVALLARRMPRLRALARELKSQAQVTVHEVDVSDRRAVEKFARQQKGLLSSVRILVNNAGLAKGLATIQEGDPSDWDSMLATNVHGLLYVTHALLPHLLRAGQGHVINIGSVAGRWSYPKGNVYCATKSAVHALSECMRLDLSGQGIRVTEISPGMVETEFSRVRLGDAARAKSVYAGMKPLSALDVAETVLWSALRPAHVNIQEIVLYPLDQASPTLVRRAP